MLAAILIAVGSKCSSQENGVGGNPPEVPAKVSGAGALQDLESEV